MRTIRRVLPALLLYAAPLLGQQPTVVRGTVTDAQGAPLAAVAIRVDPVEAQGLSAAERYQGVAAAAAGGAAGPGR